MNYCTITVNEQTIGIKFGMASFRYLSEGKFVEGKSFDSNGLNEIGISHILYSGYYNNCIVKEIIPSLNFEDFVDYVETAMLNKEGISKLTEIIKIWTDNRYLKDSINNNESKKKNSSGKK
jgi:hypothetical protein